MNDLKTPTTKVVLLTFWMQVAGRKFSSPQFDIFYVSWWSAVAIVWKARNNSNTLTNLNKIK